MCFFINPNDFLNELHWNLFRTNFWIICFYVQYFINPNVFKNDLFRVNFVSVCFFVNPINFMNDVHSYCSERILNEFLRKSKLFYEWFTQICSEQILNAFLYIFLLHKSKWFYELFTRKLFRMIFECFFINSLFKNYLHRNAFQKWILNVSVYFFINSNDFMNDWHVNLFRMNFKCISVHIFS